MRNTVIATCGDNDDNPFENKHVREAGIKNHISAPYHKIRSHRRAEERSHTRVTIKKILQISMAMGWPIDLTSTKCSRHEPNLSAIGPSNTATRSDPRRAFACCVVQRHSVRVAEAASFDVLAEKVDGLHCFRPKEKFSRFRVDHVPELVDH